MKKIAFIFWVFILVIFVGCSPDKFNTQSKTEEIKKIDSSKNYLDFEYSKVIAFATLDPYDYGDVYDSKNIEMSKFHEKIIHQLSGDEIRYLNETLSGMYNQDTTENIVADCFLPRHNIVFLDSNNNVVNYIFVCFECNRIMSSKNAFASMENYKDFFNVIGLKVFYRPDEHKQFYDSVYRTETNKNR